MSVTHVAGPVVGFTRLDRAIQRCAVCGEVLIDVIPSRMSVPIGQDTSVPSYAEAHLIRVDGVMSADLGSFITEELPDDFCLALVER